MKVVFARECKRCPWCGDPWCRECEMHYGDCPCPGPGQDDRYNYRWNGAELQARLKGIYEGVEALE